MKWLPQTFSTLVYQNVIPKFYTLSHLLKSAPTCIVNFEDVTINPESPVSTQFELWPQIDYWPIDITPILNPYQQPGIWYRRPICSLVL